MTLEAIHLGPYGTVVVDTRDAHRWRQGDITAAELYMLAQ